MGETPVSWSSFAASSVPVKGLANKTRGAEYLRAVLRTTGSPTTLTVVAEARAVDQFGKPIGGADAPFQQIGGPLDGLPTGDPDVLVYDIPKNHYGEVRLTLQDI